LSEGLASRAQEPTTSAATAGSTEHFPTLDGWRAVAILVVMVHHASTSIRHVFPDSRVVGWIADQFHNHGRYGVNVFFGISGFLICSRLLSELRKRGRISLLGFYTRRAFRILPPLFFCLGVLGILGLARIVPIRLSEWLSALGFCANYHFSDHTWYLGHFWSLAVEEHFYLFWPGVLALLGVKRAFRVGLVLACLVAAWRFADSFFLQLPETASRTDTQLDGLMWGCVAAILYEQPSRRAFFKSATRGWRQVGWGVLTVCTLSLVYLLVKSAFPALPQGSVKILVSPLVALLIPCLLVATVLNPRDWAGTILNLPPLQWIGRLSYSLYLWQQLFLVNDFWRSPRMIPLQSFPLNFVASIACAAASYYFLEKPLVALGGRISRSLLAASAKSRPAA
jgi:peptidoglycan/LPS O-acetylase OafA/YrhL